MKDSLQKNMHQQPNNQINQFRSVIIIQLFTEQHPNCLNNLQADFFQQLLSHIIESRMSNQRHQRKSQPFEQQYQFQPLTPNPRRLNSKKKYEQMLSKKDSKVKMQSLEKANWQKDKKDRLQLLLKQNSDLRKEIVELKINQFYHVDDKKLKQLIMEIETLKKEIKQFKHHIYQLQLENQFLKTSNQHLKADLQKDIIKSRHKELKELKELHSNDSTKCTFKNNNRDKSSQDSIMQNTIFSTHLLHHLEDDYEHFRSQEKTSPKSIPIQTSHKIPQRTKSPYSKLKRQSSQEHNEYLLYRRKQKIKNGNH